MNTRRSFLKAFCWAMIATFPDFAVREKVWVGRIIDPVTGCREPNPESVRRFCRSQGIDYATWMGTRWIT